MSEYTIYHNPRCSKSRQTLALLQENDISPEIVLYLENTPSKEQLEQIISKLGLSARDILRKGEQDYKTLNLKNSQLSETELLEAMVKYPKLIERPIVVKGGRAILGRPPENILQLIQS